MLALPDFYNGPAEPEAMFVLCSDGFRHVITPEEIYDRLNPQLLINEQMMKENAVWLTELDKQRQEVDNISVALVRTCQGG